MSPIYNFLADKKRALEELNNAIARLEIDRDIIPLLELINSNPNYYSTSSCSGRVLVIALAKPGSKKESIMLGRWHEKIGRTVVENAINDWNEFPNLYFLAQSPIIHITTSTIQSAIHLRNLGEAGGFKYSSIRSIKFIGNQTLMNKKIENESNLRITVELLSTERLNVPIGYDYKILIDDNYLDFLIRIANDVIEESHKKIKKLEEILKSKL